MKIAIMGATDSVYKIYKALTEENQDIEFIKYAEDEIEKLISLANNIGSDIDGIFFTGISVYSKISSIIKFEQPTIYTERGPIGIIKALWEFNIEHKDKKNINIALDIVEEKDLIDILNEFDISIKNYTIQKYLPSKNENDYLDYYLKKYKNNEINCVFTSFGYTYNYLKNNNIPVYRIQATNIDIKNRFSKLLNMINLRSINERVVQVQIIKVLKDSYENYKSICNETSIEEKILSYSKQIEAMMQTISNYEFLIISNKGPSFSDENINSLYNIINYFKLEDVVLSVGIGEGDTLYQSEKNARNALRKSIFEGNGDIYYYDGENVIGPIMKEEQIKYKNIVDKKVLNLSKEIGISSQYIEKINAVIKKLGRNEFTSKELSDILSISERSINRILKKIMDKGYAKESGLENSLGSGRPRRKIQINLE